VQATDVIANDAPIEGRIDNGVWRSRTTIEGLGYRVIRLVRTK
jgi:hypothetical protein